MNGASLTVYNGLVLNGTVLLGNAGGNYGGIYFGDSSNAAGGLTGPREAPGRDYASRSARVSRAMVSGDNDHGRPGPAGSVAGRLNATVMELAGLAPVADGSC